MPKTEAQRESKRRYETKLRLREQREQASADYERIAESGLNGTIMTGAVNAWVLGKNPIFAAYPQATIEAAGLSGGKVPTVILQVGDNLVRIRVDTPERRLVNERSE